MLGTHINYKHKLKTQYGAQLHYVAPLSADLSLSPVEWGQLQDYSSPLRNPNETGSNWGACDCPQTQNWLKLN